jgi:hypothetical protein
MTKTIDGMYQRDSNAAFDNAKKDASFQPREFMYMYSKDGRDYFKNTNFRNYVNFKFVDGVKYNGKKIADSAEDLFTKMMGGT